MFCSSTLFYLQQISLLTENYLKKNNIGLSQAVFAYEKLFIKLSFISNVRYLSFFVFRNLCNFEMFVLIMECKIRDKVTKFPKTYI